MEEEKKAKRNWADDESSDDEDHTQDNQSDDKNVDPNAPQASLQQEREQGRRKETGQDTGRDMQQAPSSRNSTSDIPMTGPFVAFVGNLPFDTTENDVGNFFHDGGCNVDRITIKLDDSGKSRGFAHVEFSDRKSLILSFDANGARFGGRDMKVDYQSSRSKSDRGGRSGGGDRDGDRRDRNSSQRDETEMPWDRKATPLPPKNDDRSSRRGSERDNRDNRGGDNRNDRSDNRGGGNVGSSRKETEQLPPAVRPKIILAPRKVPLEGSEAPIAKVSDIFGGGKPHDENKYEVSTYIYISF